MAFLIIFASINGGNNMSIKRLCIMAIVFTFLLSITAFADNIAGGNGIITGLDDSLSYKAKEVTVNTAGNGCAY